MIELGWGLLAFLCASAAIIWFWQDSLGARERANAAAMEACQRLALQFLDGTVAFARLSLLRTASGRLGLERTYIFDYTANSIERRQGFVILAGRRVESVGFAPGDADRATQAAAEPATSAPPPSNVLHLEDWRARRPHRAPPAPRHNEDRSDGWY